MSEYYAVVYSRSLSHHGIKGQKWGVRRYRNYDGSLTNAGKQRNKDQKETGFHLTDKQKKYLKIGAAVAITGLAVYGAYKFGKSGAPLINDINIVDPEKILPRSKISHNLKQAITNVNTSNEVNHCNQNAVAACMRYLGADVDTKAGVFSQAKGSIVDKCFKGMSENKIKEPMKKFNNASEVSDFIIRRLHAEDGSCGVVSGPLKNAKDNAGHCIMWCMEKGEIKFTDPWARTPGGHVTVEDASFYFEKAFTGERLSFSRLDNLEINPSEFEKYFKFAK